MSLRFGSVFAAGFLLASLVAYEILLGACPPVGLAAPTRVFQAETEVCVGAFVLLAVVWEPVRRSLAERLTRISHLLEGRIEVRGLAWVTAVLAVVIGLFDFGFWATADVLGGYNGYGWSLAEHPYTSRDLCCELPAIRPVGRWDTGYALLLTRSPRLRSPGRRPRNRDRPQGFHNPVRRSHSRGLRVRSMVFRS